MNNSKTSPLESHGSVVLPPIGLGTYRLNGTEGARAIAGAIDAGYRLVDSAFNYENEGAVGEAVRLTSVPREDLIITSKLPGRHHRYDEATSTIEESAYRLGLDHIDLYLIHWPLPRQDQYVEAWQAMLDARERGLIRWVGVSNFLPEHLERLERETGVLPDVNQVQLHPYFPDVDMVAWDREHGIITEAWSPLGRGGAIFEEKVIREVADNHGVTPAQAIIAWHVARGVIPIPKASTYQRQVANLEALEITLTAAEVEAITALGAGEAGAPGRSPNAGRMGDSDPATHEEF